MERLIAKSLEDKEKNEKQKKEEEEMQFKTKIGRAIYQTVCSMKSRIIERSELFINGRMAYVFELGKYIYLSTFSRVLVRNLFFSWHL